MIGIHGYDGIAQTEKIGPGVRLIDAVLNLKGQAKVCIEMDGDGGGEMTAGRKAEYADVALVD